MTWETASLVLAWETASPELDSEPMDCELEDNSEAPTLCVVAGVCSDTQVVADRGTSVFRPTPIVYTEPAVKCTQAQVSQRFTL